MKVHPKIRERVNINVINILTHQEGVFLTVCQYDAEMYIHEIALSAEFLVYEAFPVCKYFCMEILYRIG